jgi:methylated-DNA-[protein]-cysteine S-methyltransferase
VSLNRLQLKFSVGKLILSWNEQGLLTAIHWDRHASAKKRSLESEIQVPTVVSQLAEQLAAYRDDGAPLGEVPWESLELTACSEFQTRVYREAARIPHGETRTYAWLASGIGSALASRAVGQALRKNPFPILIPCHRVVAFASLGGFMGMSDPGDAELQFKRKLLELENSYCNPCFSFMQVNEPDSALGAAG